MARGKLRIYLGAAPGVGKTVAMLSEGLRRKGRGTDVVIGLVESHGRDFTADLAGRLETVPRRLVEYRGTSVPEMDVDAVLARHPQVALVDELAHTNAPGSRHTKRWEDIHELLDAGINVISTVNIQHLESLNDAVASITGVKQHETVPDWVVRSADQIELVDMSPEALRRRLAHGHVYPAGRVDAALSNYFRPGNLGALRELALLWLADRVEENVTDYRQEKHIESSWPTRERVLVALAGYPQWEGLLRRGARIASRGAGSELHAVRVTSDDGLRASSPQNLIEQRRLTEELGGTFHSVSGDDPVKAILDCAKAINATQIVLGADRRPLWQRMLTPGTAERLIDRAGDIDVMVIPRSPETAPRGGGQRPLSTRRMIIAWSLVAVLPVLLTLIFSLGRALPSPDAPLLTQLLGILLVAVIGGMWPAIVYAVYSSLLVNWVFTPPVGTLTIAQPSNLLALIVFVIVAIVTSAVVHRARVRTADAVAAQQKAAALAEISQALLGSTTQLRLLLERAVDMFRAEAAGVLVKKDGWQVVESTSQFIWPSYGDRDTVQAIDEDHQFVLEGADVPAASLDLLTAFAADALAILTRRQLMESARSAAALGRENEARSALLSAVSHDLRTPLAAIKAGVTSLRSGEVSFDPEDQQELLASIEDGADRLDKLIGNLLDMSRISAGALVVHPQPTELSEIVDSVLLGLGHPDRVQVASSQAWAMADAGLLERVVANLVENALRHTTGAVRVESAELPHQAVIRVVDTGPGLTEEERERVFLPFQRHDDRSTTEGVGLGLAVARGLTEGMNGTLSVEDTPGGGATFVVGLPRLAAQESQP